MGQILTALSLDLHSAMDAGPSELAKGRVSHAAGLVDQLNSKVHDTAWSLRPAALEHVNVREAVEDLVNTWSAHLGIAADVSLEALTHPIGKETAETIYRVVQEALTNVAKHSGASRICVTAQKLVAHLRITIEDDGHGFDGFATPADAHRFGIAGMRERLALVGGDLSIEARSGEGTTLYVDLPMAERRGEA
jgi:signal transduction histidine kinase